MNDATPIETAATIAARGLTLDRFDSPFDSPFDSAQGRAQGTAQGTAQGAGRGADHVEREHWLEDLALQALALKRQIHTLHAALAQVEAALKEALNDGERVVTAAGTVFSLETAAIHFTDIEAVRRALGFGFGRLVKTELVYRPDPALAELAADGNSGLGRALRAGLTLQRRQSLLYNLRATPPSTPLRARSTAERAG